MLMPMTADGTLGIAEGQETALAASKIFGMPVWAGLSAVGVRGFVFPPGLKKLWIFADRGKDGESAADALCRRALAAGIDASVYLPHGDDDFADDLTRGYSVGDYQPEQPPIAMPHAATGTPEPPAGSLAAVIERFNAQYAVVNEAGIAIIYEQMPDLILNRKTLVRISFADLKKFYQNELIIVARRGGSTTKSSAQWWLDDPRRRQYLGGVVFDPTGAAPERCWNLWSGYSVEPAPGDWALMRQHIERVICAGNAAHAEYLLNWIARMFQQPNRPGEVAVVLRGLKGSGKGILFTWLAKAWGQHGVHITNAKHLVGNFNAHLRDAVMLFADEAFFAGDRQHESVLKGLITEPTLPIEGKYQNVVQVANMLHVGMASNSDWVVPATRDERRFFALDVADNRVGDRGYFTAIIEQMKAGGLAAMIHDMLHQDISAFEVRDIPHTDALDDQKRHSLDSLDKWLLAVLERGFAWRSRYGVRVFSEWHEFVATELFNRSYQQWCDDNRIFRPMSREQLGRRLADIYQTARPRGSPIIGEVESATLGRSDIDLIVKKDRAPGYQLGSLDEARARFADQRGVTGDWKAEP
jgi:hypothetical protein